MSSIQKKFKELLYEKFWTRVNIGKQSLDEAHFQNLVLAPRTNSSAECLLALQAKKTLHTLNQSNINVKNQYPWESKSM
jgi:hypothetical protein